MIARKTQFEVEKKELEGVAAEKEVELKRKVVSIGNLVHDSVPVSDNEVTLLPASTVYTCWAGG